MVPAEILCHIFSFISYPELYSIRSVCHEWKQQAEYSFYLRFKQEHHTLTVKVGKQNVQLVPTDYDPENQVIVFHPPADATPITEDKFNAEITFSEWSNHNDTVQKIMSQLDPHEQAQALFHLNYNPTRQQLFELADHCPGVQTRYTGDRGIIIAFHHDAGIRIDYVHTNLSWLLSGMNGDVAVQQIYASRYNRLLYNLETKGFKPIRYSEGLFRTIMEESGKLELVFDREESSVATRRLYSIQDLLKEKGVDPRVVWKYTFIKNYIYRSMYSNMDMEDVTKAILESEKKWAVQKKELMKKINRS